MDETFNYWHRIGEVVQREVVKKLSFLDRLNLRATSKSEKSLVDSVKNTMTLDDVILWMDKFEAKENFDTKLVCTELTPEALVYLLNGFKIIELTIWTSVTKKVQRKNFPFSLRGNEYLIRELKEIKTTYVCIFGSTTEEFRNGCFYLEKCWDEMGGVLMQLVDARKIPLNEVFHIRSIRNMVEFLEVQGLEPEQKIPTIELWMGMSPKIKAQLEIRGRSGRLMDKLVDHFHSRLIKYISYMHILIISTDDPSKEIIIFEDWAFRVTSVPARLPMEQYFKYIKLYDLDDDDDDDDDDEVAAKEEQEDSDDDEREVQKFMREQKRISR